MELFFYCVLLYAGQCVVTLPATGLTLTRLLGASWAAPGPGFRVLSPWPGGVTLGAGGYPFELGADRVYTESPRRFLGGGSLTPCPRSQPLACDGGWTARGIALCCGDRSFLATFSKAHAAHLAAFLRGLAAAKPETRAGVLAAELDAAFDLDACRLDFNDARRRTRALRWISSAYAALVFVLLPVLLAVRDSEAAWMAVVPAIAALHASGVVALLLASRGLAEAPSVRFERVFAGALYPPVLLRAAVDMVSDRLVRFHPLTVASVALRPRELRRVLQVARAGYAHPVWQRHQRDEILEEVEREAFLARLQTRVEALARRQEIDLGLERHDPTAASACPLCLFEYRPGFDHCAACGVPTRAFAN